jgi:lipoprotein-releasing system permease protein
MNFTYLIAKRYLLGEKSRNAINYITGISIAVTALVTMSLVVILSVFNGLSGLVSSMYGDFDPELKITPLTGKYFSPEEALSVLGKFSSDINYSVVIEENVLLRYGKKQFIGRIKGVEANYLDVTRLDSLVNQGGLSFIAGKRNSAAVGQGLAYSLSVGLNFLNPIHVYAPNPKAGPGAPPDRAFIRRSIFPEAIFASQQDIDGKYMISPLGFAQEVLGAAGKASAIEISVKGNQGRQHEQSLQRLIAKSLPENLRIRNLEEQHEFLFKVMKSEKWAIFLIITFILIIASFNIVGSLSMLIIDKKEDIKVFKSLGASTKQIKRIFIAEGLLISATGIFIGMSSGVAICLAQEHFGLLKLQGAGSFIVEAYPVDLQLRDLAVVVLTVAAIGLSAAFYPVSKISQKYIK